MPPKLPTADQFPTSVTLEIIAPPNGQPPTNLLILLHGFGGTQESIASFARSMALPETACLSIRGHARMPFDVTGYHWGDDIVFNQATKDIDLDSGFSKGLKLVSEDIISKILVDKCGYKMREIILFGFGQGGMLTLEVARKLEEEMSGVVSIGGGLPSNGRFSVTEPGKCKTPVLVCKGKERSAVEDEDEDRLRDRFEFIKIKEWNRAEDGMPRNREEMFPIMEFFSRRLKSTRGVPAGSLELS